MLGLFASGAIVGRDVRLQHSRSAKSWSVRLYRIYYHIMGEELHVLRIYHQARRPIEE